MIRLIRSRDYTRKPWKNGGGMLADIVMAPKGAGLDAFDWRISAAHVGVSGPFSMFPGIDRSMVVLAGEGLRLDIVGQAPRVLGLASPPIAFPGDVPAQATLTAGPVDDLNVMTRRGRFAHTLRRERIGTGLLASPTAGGVNVIYVEAGTVVAEAATEVTAEAGDTLVLEEAAYLIASLDNRCCLIEIVRVAP